MKNRISANGYAFYVQDGKRIYVHRKILRDKIGDGEHPCFHCGRMVAWDKWHNEHPRDALVVDHLDANKLNNDPDNLVPSCNRCNSLRGAEKFINNMRSAQSVTYNGVTLLPSEWARQIGITTEAFRYRLKTYGLVERTFAVPGITFNGVTRSVKEWAATLGISAATMYSRVYNWGLTERTFTVGPQEPSSAHTRTQPTP